MENSLFKKEIFKKIGVSVVFLFVLLSLSSCGTKPVIPQWDSILYQTYLVKTWKVIENKEYIWYTKPAKQATISAEVWGTITNVFFDVWDKVKRWQTLITIDTDETAAKYDAAVQSVAALRKLYNSTEKLFDAQLQAAQKKVEQAKIAMEIAEVWSWNWTTDQELKQLELQIETYKTELEKTKTVLKTKEQQLYKNSINALSNAQIWLNSIWNFIDELFWITLDKRIYDDKYEVYLWAKNQSLKNRVKEEWFKLRDEYNTLTKKIIKCKSKDLTNLSDEDKQFVYNTLLETEKFLNKVRAYLSNVYSVVDASVSSVVLPQSQIDWWKQQINQMKQQVEQMLLVAQWNFLLWVQWSRQAIDDFENQNNMQITLLQKKIEIAKQQYKATKDKALKWYEIAKQQYQEALSSLNVLKSQKQAQLAQIKTQIAQAIWQKNTAEVYLNNATVKAPFDAVVLQKHVEEWQFIWPWMPVATLWSDNLYEIQISVPISDSKKYKIWQNVKIYIVDLNKYFTWTITVISPSTDMMTKKIMMKISFVSSNIDIPFGAYTKVFIPVYKHIWYKIPIDFVRYDYGQSYVYKLGKIHIDKKINNRESSEITKFLKNYISLDFCDDKYCIVKFWLRKWDILINK